jgi:hypothetical protein
MDMFQVIFGLSWLPILIFLIVLSFALIDFFNSRKKIRNLRSQMPDIEDVNANE